MVLWVGVLMLANAIFHLVATIALRRYSPGVVTGTLLCLPFSLLFLRAVVRDLGIPVPAVGAMALLGGVPMYVPAARLLDPQRRTRNTGSLNAPSVLWER